MNRDEFMLNAKKILFFLPDKAYVRLYYEIHLKRKLNLEHPRSLNEKLQWMKFNCRNPLQTIVSDKYTVRNYVQDRIGVEYLIPLLGVWNKFEDINFSLLPERFVLKCNHDSGGLIIVKNKRDLDIEAAQKKINKSLSTNFYKIGREWQYRNIIPRIICEQFISENGAVPKDYKIYCFNGKPDCILVCTDRFAENSHRAKYYFYDKEWNFLRYNKGDENINAPQIEKPKNLDLMLGIAEKLSKDFAFARIDLYNVRGKVYFGEITLSPNSGFDNDITEETDMMFGKKLIIPYWNQIRGGGITI